MAAKHTIKPKLQHDAALPADSVVCRIALDVLISNDVQQRVRAGIVAREYLDQANELERRAWSALAAYLSAKAYAWAPSTKRPRRRR